MPKSDIDALVMYLLDKYGLNGGVPFFKLTNQEVSEKLRAPISKIKKLRYDSSLKFSDDVQLLAKVRLLAALANASFDIEDSKIHIIIEDSLAKNWLQAEIKKNQLVFNNSFNSELVIVNPSDLFNVLDLIFPGKALVKFKSAYNAKNSKIKGDELKTEFSRLTKEFVSDVVKSAAGTFLQYCKMYALGY